MNPSTRSLSAAAALLLALSPVLAAPGAHGPNGEHLDAPATTSAAPARPRVEAQTEAYELVAELRPGELAIVVDRYASNEPVLGAKLEVESRGAKAVAAFRPDRGDYAVTDAALLKALAAPGEHPLVFTLVAAQDSDLLDGTLVTAKLAAPAGGHEHEHDAVGHDHGLERAAWIGGGVAVLGLLAGIAWWRLRRRAVGALQGGL